MGGEKIDMTTKDKLDRWISDHYKWLDGQIKANIAKGQMKDYADDLLAEMIIFIYEMKEEKIDRLLEEGKLKWYILSGAGMQLRSNTSPFWRIHRKHKMYARENGIEGSDKNIFDRPDDTEELSTECYFSCMKREIENLHWYHKTLLREYWEQGMHLDDLHAKYKISKKHLTKDLNEAILTIRENCKECD